MSLCNMTSEKRCVLLRSSWQTVNIGDIGHSPGVLGLLEKHLPDVKVILWAGDVSNGVREMLMRRFPELTIVQTSEDVKKAIDESHFLLHGSGPDFVAKNDVKRWRDETGKPYGVFGITLVNFDDEVRDLLSDASFVFFATRFHLGLLRKKGFGVHSWHLGPMALLELIR